MLKLVGVLQTLIIWMFCVNTYSANAQDMCYTPNIIRQHGYLVEVHQVVTDDGYLLEVYRIPQGRLTPTPPSQVKRVAFLQHGLFCSAAAFVVSGPNTSLAYMLADAGWDVWLGNARGATGSRKHVTLSNTNPLYWNFSWDQIGRYDVPAMLKYVRNISCVAKLDYIGHSLGCGVFFVMMHYRPEINLWIRTMTALAPAAYMSTSQTTETILFASIHAVEFTLDAQLQPEFGRDITRFTIAPTTATMAAAISLNIAQVKYMNQSLVPTMTTLFPETTSVHKPGHLGQLVSSGRFEARDLGILLNLQTYGTVTPSVYKLSRVTVPVSVFWSDGDTVTLSEAIKKTASELPNVVLNQRIGLPDFGHLDFLFAANARTVLYQYVLKYMLSI